AEAVEPQRAKKGVQLSTEIAPEINSVHGDPEKLYAVMLNLLDNAIKFTPSGGTVTLRAVESERGVEIAVEDNGIGIPEADLDRVFERFYRVQRPGEE